MEAIEIASFFQQTVNRLRVWRGLPEHLFSQYLYDRSLEACSKACYQDLRTTAVIAGYGFGQHVSRVNYHSTRSSQFIGSDLVDEWIKQSPKISSVVLKHSFSGIAVVIKGTTLYVGLSISESFSNPFMREIHPKSILKPPKFERPLHNNTFFSSKELRQIEDSALLDLNIALRSFGCHLNFDDHLHRLAVYYSREASDFGIVKAGKCTMARTVFMLNVRGAEFETLGNLVALEIIKRLGRDGNYDEAWGGIGVVESECLLWVSVVCYYQSLYL